MTTPSKVLSIAKKEVGTTERGYTNDVKYNTWFYGRKVSGSAYPWCAAFTSWVLAQAGLKRDVDYPHSAGVAVLFAWFERKGRIISRTKLRAGDLVRYDKFSHVGIFSHYEDGGRTAITYEGNTSPGNSGSQRDGGGVWRRRRNIGLIRYGGRPFYKAAAKPPLGTSSPKKEEGLFGMSIKNAGRRTKDIALPKGKWKMIPVNDKGDVSLRNVSKGTDILAMVDVTLEGLPKGAEAAVRFVLDGYKKGSKTQRVYSYPSTEIIGSAGKTFGQAVRMDKVGRVSNNAGYSTRLRCEIMVHRAGVKLTDATFKVAK